MSILLHMLASDVPLDGSIYELMILELDQETSEQSSWLNARIE